MAQCIHFDAETYEQCPDAAVGQGLCAAHLQATRQVTPVVGPAAIKFTNAELKKEFGALCKIKEGDKGGGYYLGAGAKGMHVHKYGSPGAHVKVGKDEHRFIRPTGNFDQDEWNGGVAAVKARAAEKTTLLLAAMAITVCEHGALSDNELDLLLKDCRV